MPRLGQSFVSITIPVIIIGTFLVVWLLGNDMKVLRALIVWAIGDATEVTRDWLRIDPRLVNYRIFAYDGYRLAFYLSAGLIPLSLFGLWHARRSLRLAKFDKNSFGGYRIARTSWALSLILFLAFSAAAVTSIPGALERSREKRVAATAAQMYQLQETLQKYYREYGTYPQELTDLNRFNRGPLPQSDYWERGFSYAPVSVIASKGHAIGWSNYRLVSAGPDGQFGNEDDLTMIDGVIISTPSDTDLRTGFPAPAQPRQ
ncbi:MAG: type II secretion system protein GspG, partial [Acidobacteriota bacterium]